jgi:hypothetical protein
MSDFRFLITLVMSPPMALLESAELWMFIASIRSCQPPPPPPPVLRRGPTRSSSVLHSCVSRFETTMARCDDEKMSSSIFSSWYLGGGGGR